MRLPVSILSLIVVGTVLLAAPLPACSPRAAHNELPQLRWEPDDDVTLSYGILLLDQSLRDDDVSGILEAARLLADVSPSSRPFVDAAAWLLLNRSPALTREVLEPAIRRFPDDINPRLLMAESWLEDKKPESAVKLLKEYSGKHPDSIQARQELAVIHTKAGQYAEALTVFATLPAKAFTPFIRYCHAKALAGTDRQAEAIQELRKTVEEMPEFIEAWSDLAKIYEARKDPRQAAGIYEHILEQEPGNKGVWLRLITAYIDAGDRPAALEVAKGNLDSFSLSLAATGLFLERKMAPEADAMLELLRKNPDVPEEIYFYLAAAAYEGHNDIPEALKWLDRVTPGNPFFERSLRFRAQLLFESKKAPEALAALHSAQKQFPAEASLYMMEAHMLNQEKRHADALAVLDRVMPEHAGNLDMIYSRAMTLDQLGRKDEAVRIMEGLIAENPDYYQALNYIGYSLAEQRRDLPRALALLVKADQLSPDTSHIVDSLAWAQFHLGKLDEAWTSIQRAVKLEGGDDAVIWEHYGDIAKAKKLRDDARRAYAKSLELGHEKPDQIRAKMEKL